MKRVVAALVFGLVALGCVPPVVDLRGRACPCGPEWVCVDGTCVPEGEANRDGGELDAGAVDAALVDGGPMDAAPGDGGAADAGIADAGIADAGSMDAALDASLDGGAADAGVPDSGVGETGCTGPLSSALVCDGFEAPGGPWTGRNERVGSADRSTARAHLGGYALHAETMGSNGQAALRRDGLGPFVDGELWVRLSLFLPSSALVQDFTFAYVGEISPPFQGVSLGIGSDGVAGAFSTISATYVSNVAELLVPRDRWVCFELRVVASESGGSVEVFMDGISRASVGGLDTVPGAGFTYVATGIDYTDPTQGPLELYVDEYAFSRGRLPCPVP